MQSDGETLFIDISVHDSSGRHWFDKSYNEKASHYSYNKKTQLRYEPFQNMIGLAIGHSEEFLNRQKKCSIASIKYC